MTNLEVRQMLQSNPPTKPIVLRGANTLGLTANASMTKEELLLAIDALLATRPPNDPCAWQPPRLGIGLPTPTTPPAPVTHPTRPVTPATPTTPTATAAGLTEAQLNTALNNLVQQLNTARQQDRAELERQIQELRNQLAAQPAPTQAPVQNPPATTTQPKKSLWRRFVEDFKKEDLG